MTKGRLEAFSDGVIAVIITIMVLELKPPLNENLSALLPLLPVFLGYVLSFLHVGIYWNNHHHLFQAVERINGRILWANLHLLFWLSLVPFVTSWMGESHFSLWPVVVYGSVLLMSAMAYYLMTLSILAIHGPSTQVARAIANDRKEKISLAIYVGAIAAAFCHPYVACAAYGFVAILWLIPDRRIESVLADEPPRE